MPIHVMRSTLALALAGGVFAPAAAAQTLVPLVGDPIAYQVEVPEGWAQQEDEGMVYVFNGEDVMMVVAAEDIMADQENPLPVSEAESRRIFTNMIVDSDSMLLAMLNEGFVDGMGIEVRDAVQEIRALDGQRAAYMRGRVTSDGEEGWLDVYLTMKDGIMYVLGFVVLGDGIEAHDPLITRVHASFTMADAPN